MVTHPNLTNDYFATRFGYAANERAVSFALGESWQWDGVAGNDPTGYTVNWAREFRYDGARQRYLDRALEPAPLMATGARVALSSVWTDYDGNQPYGDHDYVDGNFVESTSYQPGLARVSDPLETLGTPVTAYYHGDMLGTTRHMTNSGGNVVDSAAYTAFGELKSGTSHRYGYVGEYGYQQHAEMPFMHVGHRYYDPGTGRFLQRDPIGIAGGLNVYAYVRSSPTQWIDSDGTDRHPKGSPGGIGGRFKKKPWWKKTGKGKLSLAGLCLWLVEREVVPRLDKWIQDDYDRKMREQNRTPTPSTSSPPRPSGGSTSCIAGCHGG